MTPTIPGHGLLGSADLRSDLERLAEHQQRWKAKGALRRVYRSFHRRVLAELPAGRLLEIGSGTGHLAESITPPRVLLQMDILPSPGTHVRGDAHHLPMADGSFDGIAMIDTLHHLQQPARFLREAARVLRRGGRIAMIEPGITPLSGFLYRRFHDEPVDLCGDPWRESPSRRDWGPYDANQAVPTLLFSRQNAGSELEERIPELRLLRSEWMSLWAYPLSGGFRRWSLLPAALVDSMLRFEDRLLPWLGSLAAFRLFVVLERVSADDPPGSVEAR